MTQRLGWLIKSRLIDRRLGTKIMKQVRRQGFDPLFICREKKPNGAIYTYRDSLVCGSESDVLDRAGPIHPMKAQSRARANAKRTVGLTRPAKWHRSSDQTPPKSIAKPFRNGDFRLCERAFRGTPNPLKKGIESYPIPHLFSWHDVARKVRAGSSWPAVLRSF